MCTMASCRRCSSATRVAGAALGNSPRAAMSSAVCTSCSMGRLRPRASSAATAKATSTATRPHIKNCCRSAFTGAKATAWGRRTAMRQPSTVSTGTSAVR